jgi:ubiquinone/menaquinone biosynthesis C-methylase UbiE
MAAACPKSSFVGYDISRHALDRAEQKKRETGATNAMFCDPRDAPMPADHSVDLLTTFDCMHDMTHPQQMMESIRSALADDGTWLLVEIKSHDSFEQNVRKNPMASLMYGTSVLSCMSSALSEPDGAGLGTLGLSANKARAMAEQAGFTRFRKLDIDHSVNAFYEVRP